MKVLRITHGLVWRVPVPKLSSSTAAAGVVVALVSSQLVVGGVVAWIRSQSAVLAVIGLVLSAAVPFGVYLLASRLLPAPSVPGGRSRPGRLWSRSV